MNAELQTGTREEYWLKNRRKVERLGYDLDRVLMVDDEPHKLEKNHDNHAPTKLDRAISVPYSARMTASQIIHEIDSLPPAELDKHRQLSWVG